MTLPRLPLSAGSRPDDGMFASLLLSRRDYCSMKAFPATVLRSNETKTVNSRPEASLALRKITVQT
jgi:hypothetical protein